MSERLAGGRWLLIAFVVAMVCLLSVTAYAQTFSVSGAVTLTASHTLPKNLPNQTCATVQLARYNGSIPGSTLINTDASGNGTYSFTGLPTGDYTVGAYAYELPPGQATCATFPKMGTTPATTYTIKFYDGTADSHAGAPDQNSANFFTLGPSNQTQTVNFNLVDTTNGSVSGQVTSGGVPVANASVSAMKGFGQYSVLGRNTDANGNYTIHGLNPDQYIITVSPPAGFALKKYINALTYSTATPFAVAGGAAVTNINVALDTPNGSISGFVTDANGLPVSNLCVSVRDKASTSSLRGGCPDPSTGAYTISRLPPGTYRLRVMPAEAGYVSQYYGGQGTGGEIAEKTFTTAVDVVVTAGQTTSGINFTMAANPGRILGTVTRSDTGAPIMGADVGIQWPNSNESAGYGTSSADGSYLARGLAPGFYKVRVGHPDFVTKWFSATGGGLTSNDGGFVSVTANTDTTNINMALDPNPGSITGKVTSDGTTPVPGVSVSAILASNLSSVYGARAREDGTYQIIGLAPGSYVVRVSQQYNDPASPGASGSAVQYYSNKVSRETGDPVIVTANTATPNINFILSPTFGSLSGRVTRTDGTTGVEEVTVRAYDAATGNRVFEGTTNSTGAFTVSQLPPGTYKVLARAHGFAERFYLAGQPGAPTIDLATPVTVTATTNVPGVNISLEIPLAKVGAFRPGDGTFYLDYNGSGTWEGCGTDKCLSIGLNGDIPLVGDWNGSGTGKVGTFRPSDGTFYLDYNGNGIWDGCGTDRCLQIGMLGDIPLVGDWNGSGTSKVGAFRPSDGTFYLDANGNGVWDGCGTDRCLQIGMNGDIPLVGDWNGSGFSKVGAFRPTDGTFYLDYNGNGAWDGCGTDKCLGIGMNGDIPLVGDWNGSGTSKVGAFRPTDGTFYLDYNGNGAWDGCGTDKCLGIGMNGDIPLVGDWNGSGTAKVGAFRPTDGTFYLDYNGSGTWEGCGTDRCLSIGMNGDAPLVGKW